MVVKVPLLTLKKQFYLAHLKVTCVRPVQRTEPPIILLLFHFVLHLRKCDFTLYIAILTLTFFKIKHFLIMKYVESLCDVGHGFSGSPR